MLTPKATLLASALAALIIVSAGRGQDKDKIEYGRYLTEEVAKCQDCHSPRAENGQLDRSKWMKGAVLDFAPMKEMKGWHKTAPDLTPGSRLWDRWKKDGLVKFLETGTGPNGHAADPPMPAYKLKKADAEAVVEFLESLK